jgi:phosphoribosylglycinamide formyltransferase-1
VTAPRLVRAAILGSSGGSTLRSAVACLQRAGYGVELLVITDRECGLHAWGVAEAHDTVRIPFTGRTQFSRSVANVLRDREHDDLLLFYTRLVSAPLIDDHRVANIHPSLLPAFPGMHGVADAVQAGARLLGATLHRVDAGMDTGPIVAQVACALPSRVTLARANRLSYLQRVWLTLVWFDRLRHGNVAPPTIDAERLLGAGVGVTSAQLTDGVVRDAYCDWVCHLESNPAHCPTPSLAVAS